MSKKNNGKTNPILRNLIVVAFVVIAAIAFGMIAIWGGKLVSWILGFGKAVLITVMASAIVFAIVFGIVEKVWKR